MDLASIGRAGGALAAALRLPQPAVGPSFDPATGRPDPQLRETGRIAGPDGDIVAISEDARRLFGADDTAGSGDDPDHDGDHHGRGRAVGDGDGDGGGGDAEGQQVRELEQRDREVRQHERAHQAAAGGLSSGGAAFTTQIGPDGQHYAVGGEVQIRLEEGRTPAETIRKMDRVRAAALAPAEPSAQDRAVAAEAGRIAAAARRERTEAGDEPERGRGPDQDESSSGRPRRRVDVIA